MLKQLFGAGKPDHPLADPKEARRLLGELSAADPLKGLEDLAHWHESVAAAEGFRPDARILALISLDDAAQPRIRKVAGAYLAAARPSRVQENLMWARVYEYWRQAGLAYTGSIEELERGAKGADAARPLIPQLCVRAARAVGQRLKWLHLRYGPIDGSLWRMLNGIYAFAEARGAADAKAPVHAGAAETTPRLEYLRALVLYASSPDSLLPPEVEVAERLIGELAATFELAKAAGKQSSHWIDLAEGMAPLRLAKRPQTAPGVRFLGAAAALRELESMIQRIEGTRQLPASLAGELEPEAALALLRHLATYWSPVPPERKHPRHHVKSRLSIVHGFEGVRGVLNGAAAELARGAENWIVENVSAGGFGAVVPQAKGDWLKIGALLAMQPDGGNNWVVGMVRRVSKISSQESRVGIQTLSRAPELAHFSVRGNAEEGVLLPAPGVGMGETTIALRSGVFVAGQNLESARAGRSYMYLPQGLSERGEDYDIVRFREMIREA